MELDLTTTSKFNVLEILATRIVAATNVDTAVTSQPSAPAPRDAVVRVIALTAVAKVAITATTLTTLTPMPTTATRVTLAVIMMTTMTIFMTTAFTDQMQPRNKGLMKVRRQRSKRQRSLKPRRPSEKGRTN